MNVHAYIAMGTFLTLSGLTIEVATFFLLLIDQIRLLCTCDSLKNTLNTNFIH